MLEEIESIWLTIAGKTTSTSFREIEMREILIHRRVAIRIALLSRNFNFKSDCSSIAIYESEDFITPDYRPLIKKINYDVL